MITLEQARNLIGTNKEFYRVWETWKGNCVERNSFEDFEIIIKVVEGEEKHFLYSNARGVTCSFSLEEVTIDKQEAVKKYLLNQIEVAKHFMESEPVNFQQEYLKMIKGLFETSTKLEK